MADDFNPALPQAGDPNEQNTDLTGGGDNTNPAQPQDPPAPQEPFLVGKFDGKDFPIQTREEAIRKAQLGEYYEKKIEPEYKTLKEELENYRKNKTAYELLHEEAKADGFDDVNLYAMAIKESRAKAEFVKAQQEQGADPVQAGMIWDAMNLNKPQPKPQVQQEEVSTDETPKIHPHITELAENFPDEVKDYDKNELLKQVVSQWESGGKVKNLSVMYSNAKLEQARIELAAVKGMSQNAAASTGSAGNSGAVEDSDYFTEEQVSKMTQSEVNKNYNKILKSMKLPTWKN